MHTEPWVRYFLISFAQNRGQGLKQKSFLDFVMVFLDLCAVFGVFEGSFGWEGQSDKFSDWEGLCDLLVKHGWQGSSLGSVLTGKCSRCLYLSQ